MVSYLLNRRTNQGLSHFYKRMGTYICKDTDVQRLTKSFAVKLGQGGFGALYKGNLSNGSQVAVKNLRC
jgi:hypothetical protein